jgi:DNA-binding CsgD family transcriptional regulator
MPEAPHTPLTATEIVVADLAAQGKRNEEIADELGVARKTVEWHLSHVYRKLGLRSRTELAARAARENPWASAKPE